MKNIKSVLILVAFLGVGLGSQSFVLADQQPAKSQAVIQEEASVNTLNGLIASLNNSEKGLSASANTAKNPQLKELFDSLAKQRAEYSKKLRDKVRDLGGEPAVGESAGGGVHSGWLNTLAVANGGSEKSIINEAINGEGATSNAYQDALIKGLPNNINNLLKKQEAEVNKAHNLMQSLKASTDQDLSIEEAFKAAKKQGLKTKF